jgi:hypothetical protein
MTIRQNDEALAVEGWIPGRRDSFMAVDGDYSR